MHKKILLRLAFVLIILTGLLAFTLTPCAAAANEIKVVRVGYFDSPGYHEMRSDGSNKGGYGYEYLMKVASYAGWTCEYVYGNWPELLDKLKAGEIDLMTQVSYTSDRTESMLFASEPMGREEYYLCTFGLNSKIQPNNPSSLSGAKVGVNRGAYQAQLFKRWLDDNGITDCQIIEYENETDRRNDLEIGTLDGDLCVDTLRYPNWVPLYTIGESDFYFVVKKDRPDLLAELNEAQGKIFAINPYYNGELKLKYYRQKITSMELTVDERRWCLEKGTIKVGILKDCYPYCGVNVDNGEVEGICTLVANTMERKFGLKVNWKVFESYSALLRALQNGTVDAAFPAEGNLWLAEKNNYSQSNPVVTSTISIVYDIKSELGGEKISRVAVARENPIQTFFTAKYWPKAQVIYCNTLNDCTKFVSEEKADAFVFTSNGAAREVQSSVYHHKLREMNVPDSWECCFAVRDNKKLLSIIDKGITLVDNVTLAEAMIKYSQGEHKYGLSEFIRDNAEGIIISVLLLSIVTVAAIAIRMSEESKAQKAADEARHEVELANAISLNKSAFLANMSHELRTPINVILGMNEMILRENNNSVTKARAIDIKSAAQILLGLINDVLDFSKIESGQMHVVSAKYNLVSLVSDLALLSESRARQKSLVFKMDIDPDLPIGLYGDDVHLRQVFTNLLTNAIKYTPEGTVTLRMKLVSLPNKASSKRDITDNDFVTIHCEVEDTGIGIKAKDIHKLFIPYSRVDEYKNRTVEGTGLGLTIIINLLKLMGSELEVNSTYGKGSVFYFDIKQRVTDPEHIGDILERISETAKEYEYKVPFTAPKAHVLVVDDNAMNREIFADLLADTKIQVTAASSGKKCLDLVQKEHFDIIFMDHLMPEMDGLETLQRLETLAGNLCKDSPVIALTANAFSGDREQYMSWGFDDMLTKPIATEKLEDTIRQRLPAEYIEAAPVKASAGRDDNAVSNYNVDAEIAFPEIEGVDWDYANLRIRNRPLLLKSLKRYYQGITSEHDSIENMAAKVLTGDGEGINDYRIRVHSLKSTSAQLGILSVSTLAKLLEYAARDNNLEKIRALNPLLLDELMTMKERLAPAQDPEQENLNKQILSNFSDGEVSGLLDMLQYHLSQMDIGKAFEVMDKIRSYKYTQELQEQVDRLGEKVTALEFDEAAEEITRLTSAKKS